MCHYSHCQQCWPNGQGLQPCIFPKMDTAHPLGQSTKATLLPQAKNWQALNSRATSIPIQQRKRVAMNGSSSYFTFTSVVRHRNIFYVHHMQTHSYSLTSYVLSESASFVMLWSTTYMRVLVCSSVTCAHLNNILNAYFLACQSTSN
jgi:hypothetical protein